MKFLVWFGCLAMPVLLPAFLAFGIATLVLRELYCFLLALVIGMVATLIALVLASAQDRFDPGDFALVIGSVVGSVFYARMQWRRWRNAHT